MTRGPVFVVEGTGWGACVMRDGEVVAGPFHGREMAELCADGLERQARMRERPCLCCQRRFLSEGAHNRMCERCRGAAHQVHTGSV